MNSSSIQIRQLGFIPPPYGGVSVYVKRLTEQLNRDGYPTRAYKTAKDAPIKNIDFYDDFKHFGTLNFISRYFSFIHETKNFQIVHSHTGLEGAKYLLAISFFSKKKIVITLHNSMAINTYYHVLRPWDKFFLRLQVKQNVKWIAISQQAKTEMERLPLDFGLIEVVPAYIPPQPVQDIEEFLSEQLIHFIHSYNVIITFYGHCFMYNQGIDVYGYKEALEMFTNLLREAPSLIKSVGLVFCISDCNNKLAYQELLKIAKENNIEKNIYWQIGPINEMAALWQVTDVYIRPTSTDGDSVAVREALGLGINVVASNIAPRPDATNIYNLNDINDFTAKVLLAIKKGKNKTNETDLTYYKKVLSIYKDILNKN